MKMRQRLLMAFVLVVMVGNTYGQAFEPKGNGVFMRAGYQFKLTAHAFDTIILTDPVTGKELSKVQEAGGVPCFVNGKKIYATSDVTTSPQQIKGDLSLDYYLFSNLKTEIDELQLPDGMLHIDFTRIAIDETGKLVYYEYKGLKHWITDQSTRTVNDDNIAPKINSLLENAPMMKPAMLNGKPVPCFLSQGTLLDFMVEIKNREIQTKPTK